MQRLPLANHGEAGDDERLWLFPPDGFGAIQEVDVPGRAAEIVVFKMLAHDEVVVPEMLNARVRNQLHGVIGVMASRAQHRLPHDVDI